jgi:hypothetical protein
VDQLNQQHLVDLEVQQHLEVLVDPVDLEVQYFQLHLADLADLEDLEDQ